MSKLRLLSLSAVLLVIFSCNNSSIPPTAKIIPETTKIHNIELTDNYAWLKDKSREDKDVLEYLNAENDFTEQKLKHTQKLQRNLFSEMKSRISQNDISVPIKFNNYYYYSKNIAGKEYTVYCRKKDSPDAEEEIYLDVNLLAESHSYIELLDFEISPDQNLLAYSIDTTGAEIYTLYIKNLSTGKNLTDIISNVGDVTWANDNKTIFYSTQNESNRSDKIYRHALGTHSSNDEMIYEEIDESFYVWITKTLSKKYIILGADSNITSEMRFIEADRPFDDFKLIQKRNTGMEYYVQDHDDEFFITTNTDNCKNFKIMRTEISKPGKKFWREYISHNDSIAIKGTVFNDFILLKQRHNGLRHFKIKYIQSDEDYHLDFPESIYSLLEYYNPDYYTNKFVFTYESMINPETVLEFDINTKQLTTLKEIEVFNYDKNEYLTKRIEVTANDGIKIPITMVYRKDTFSSDNPLWLNAYGAYGMSENPYFSSSRLSLLDRGVVFAIAHVRGGGEMGKEWHNSGKMFNKKNTFTDFIDCAEHLIESGYTTSEKLIAEGGSAGGLLIGTVINMRPELFRIAIADVPFVDILNTMCDPTLSATVTEYDEWGNPKIKEYFDYIYSYCPYQNAGAKDYPNLLVLAGFYDPRVNYWEPAKWVAKMRANKTNDNILLLHTNMNAGHQGASGRFDYLHETARKNAFVLDILGISK